MFKSMYCAHKMPNKHKKRFIKSQSYLKPQQKINKIKKIQNISSVSEQNSPLVV